jgi:hypothetical protein
LFLVRTQKEVSDENIAGTIQTDLRSILSSAIVSTDTASVVELPNKDIYFSCQGFRVGNQFASSFPYAFAPNLLKSDRSTISVYSYDWSMPYRITNFLYVTSPDIRYIFVTGSNTEFYTALENILPPKFITSDNGQNKLLMNRENLSLLGTPIDNGNYKVRIIYLDGSVPSGLSNLFSKTKKEDLSALSLYISDLCSGGTAADQVDCSGKLTFSNYDNQLQIWNSEDSAFIGAASLLAAIFSENYDIYSCGMNNSLQRLKSVNYVYKRRATNLSTSLAGCKTLFDNAAGYLDAIESAAESGPSQYNTIYSNAADLKLTNENLLVQSCPAVY